MLLVFPPKFMLGGWKLAGQDGGHFGCGFFNRENKAHNSLESKVIIVPNQEKN
jgi:hypothetical protein